MLPIGREQAQSHRCQRTERNVISMKKPLILLLCAAFFFLTRYILKRHLNLE